MSTIIACLGRQVFIQTFEDDVECDIEEIRQLMDEEDQDPEPC
jgi:DNA-binding transcriptional MerR regulator